MDRSPTDLGQPYEPAVSLQFYSEIPPLVNELGRAMSVALDQGHAAICVVSDSTRQILEEQISRRGIDVASARQRGQYLYLDAVDALSRICRDAAPDSARVDEVIGRPVRRLAGAYKAVWMYGELAALMWGQGHQTGAIELDKLWASFAETQPVLLCVAFPVEALSWPIVAEALQQTVADQVRELAKGSSIALAIHHGPHKV